MLVKLRQKPDPVAFHVQRGLHPLLMVEETFLRRQPGQPDVNAGLFRIATRIQQSHFATSAHRRGQQHHVNIVVIPLLWGGKLSERASLQTKSFLQSGSERQAVRGARIHPLVSEISFEKLYRITNDEWTLYPRNSSFVIRHSSFANQFTCLNRKNWLRPAGELVKPSEVASGTLVWSGSQVTRSLELSSTFVFPGMRPLA
jgi:hypothetical protein